MIEVLTMATVIAPFTSGIVQVVKQATNLKKRYIPLVAVAIGIGLGAAAYFVEVEFGARMWAGGISGLAATGLFELGKNTVDNGHNEVE
ncbi:MAG TPA: holin [Pseudogracilibacillus sp.]|nr:holin [Pseudogracilibacillus sp.]